MNRRIKTRFSNTMTWIFLTAGGIVCAAAIWFLRLAAAAAEPNGPEKLYLLRMMWLAGILLIGLIFAAILIGLRRLVWVLKAKKPNKPTETSSVWVEAGKRIKLENEDDYSIDDMLSDDSHE